MYGYCKTDKAFAKWLQGALRRVWSKHPSKLALIQKNRYQALNKTTGRRCFHIDCEKCGAAIPQGKGGGTIECNHKNTVGGFSELSKEKFSEFALNLLWVKESDLELVCKKCHDVITYMERSGMTEAEAINEKKIIKFMKNPAKIQIAKMKKAGLIPASTVAKRRIQLREYLNK
jgi:ribosomal protein L44E